MLFSKLWEFLKNRPEAFPYGDEIFHAIEVIFYILSNLAIGIAAAIVFYYMGFYLDKKKNMESYQYFRSDVRRLLFNHKDLLREIEEFKILNEEKKPGEWFYQTKDIYNLIDSYNKIHSKEQKKQFENNLINYFFNLSEEELMEIRNKFENSSKIIDNQKEKRYFKDSKDLIESFTPMMYEDGDLELSFHLFITEETKELKQQYAEELVKDYCEFLDATIVLYEELQLFMETIDKKKILQFIKMVD